ncbi:MAG: sulfite exporter TauE/SafE family protein [bacterium]|jgi:hypothetical protein|nr:sulfite exporter TauE/SafE family protein [Planctomycetaceae bacterium]
MSGLLLTVLGTSLLGSLHCAGMCGPFAVLASASESTTATTTGAALTVNGRALSLWQSHATLQAAYHSGRLFTYLAFGAAAGGLGAALEVGGSLVGVQQAAAVLAGALMVAFGILALLRAAGVRMGAASPAWLSRLAGLSYQRANALPPFSRALTIGLLTTLLPCGWLYAFVVAAAGTGSPLHGTVLMTVFWLGTLPVLAAVGSAARLLTEPLRRRLPTLTALALIAVGSVTVLQRMGHIGMGLPDISQGEAGIARIGEQPLPCCPLTGSLSGRNVAPSTKDTP